jgi:hypothetical protein
VNPLIHDLEVLKLNLLTYSEILTASSEMASSYLAQAANKMSAAIQQLNLEEKQRKNYGKPEAH